MLGKFKEEIDRENQFGALLTDLLKVFDCIGYKPLIVRFYGHGVSTSALNIISYLNAMYHKTQFWVHYFLIIIWLIYVINTKKMILQTMLTTQPIFVWYWHSHCHFRITISTKAFNWFGNHHIKVNPVQCDLLCKTKTPEIVSIDAMQIT